MHSSSVHTRVHDKIKLELFVGLYVPRVVLVVKMEEHKRSQNASTRGNEDAMRVARLEVMQAHAAQRQDTQKFLE
jgi:hypothetical protein